MIKSSPLRYFSLNSSGIYLYPPYFFLPDEGYLDKVVTKGAHEILVYSKNVKKGLVKINYIINKLKNNVSKDNTIFITKPQFKINNHEFISRQFKQIPVKP